MNYSIDSAALLAVLPFCSFDHLNTSFIQFRAGRVWATDGYVIIGHKLTIPEAEPRGIPEEGFVINIENAKNAKTLMAICKRSVKFVKYNPYTFVYYDTETSVLSFMGQTLTLSHELTPKFDVAKVIPDELKSASGIHINGDYAAKLAKISEGGVLSFYATDWLNALVVIPRSNPWIAVLMGVRNSDDGAGQLKALQADLQSVSVPVA